MTKEDLFWLLLFVGLSFGLGWQMGTMATLYRIRQDEKEGNADGESR
jgi:hypothetical protein